MQVAPKALVLTWQSVVPSAMVGAGHMIAKQQKVKLAARSIIRNGGCVQTMKNTKEECSDYEARNGGLFRL